MEREQNNYGMYIMDNDTISMLPENMRVIQNE